MSHFISIVLFVISASLDNLVVGIAYGIKKIKISVSCNLIIAMISFIGTFLSMIIGKPILKFFSKEASNLLGSSILIIIGLWFMLNYLYKEYKVPTIDPLIAHKANYSEILDNPEKADFNNSGSIDFKESLTLGAALALNNIGLGIGASITGMNIYLTSIFVLIFSFFSIPLGNILGKKILPKTLQHKAELISGIFIIILGLYEMFI